NSTLWALDVLQALHEKSLVRSVNAQAGERRFTLYESIRDYAAEKLVLLGECAEAERAHADYFLNAVEEWRRLGKIELRRRLNADRENFEAIYERALSPADAGRSSQEERATRAGLALLA